MAELLTEQEAGELGAMTARLDTLARRMLNETHGDDQDVARAAAMVYGIADVARDAVSNALVTAQCMGGCENARVVLDTPLRARGAWTASTDEEGGHDEPAA